MENAVSKMLKKVNLLIENKMKKDSKIPFSSQHFTAEKFRYVRIGNSRVGAPLREGVGLSDTFRS